MGTDMGSKATLILKVEESMEGGFKMGEVGAPGH